MHSCHGRVGCTINNHIHDFVWDVITYPCANFKDQVHMCSSLGLNAEKEVFVCCYVICIAEIRKEDKPYVKTASRNEHIKETIFWLQIKQWFWWQLSTRVRPMPDILRAICYIEPKNKHRAPQSDTQTIEDEYPCWGQGTRTCLSCQVV